uniref:DUF7730 domain-containing protein n=2 Tax=Colletotrichum fructicola (strain Nara gc5) TaxID=1213859 RepID=L2FZF4_COLFN
MQQPPPTSEAPKSPLFDLPLEVRHHIYRTLWGTATHLFLLDGDLQIMECQGADDSSRYPADEPEYENPKWIRRVDSTWGCHWRCEERYLDGAEGQATAIHMSLLPLLLSSKWLCSDVIGFISQPTHHVHLTDLDTIDLALSTTIQQTVSKLPETQPSRELKQCHLFKSLRNVNLTLRLPMALVNTLFVPFFSKMEELKTLPRPGGTPEGSGCRREYEQWMRIWPSLAAMNSLLRVGLWLDHDTEFCWEDVSETQILQGLSGIMPMLRSRDVQVNVNLPQLLSKPRGIEDDYFVHVSPEFQLQRRTRLPWIVRDYPPKEVMWMHNEENGRPPPHVPNGRFMYAQNDWYIFHVLGYDTECDEFVYHPLVGVDFTSGEYCMA